MNDLRALALGIFSAAALCACGGGTTSVAPPTSVPTASPTPAGNTTTLSIATGAATMNLPAVNGATPTVAFDAVSPPAGASIAVTVSTSPPPGAGALASAGRTPRDRAARAVTRTTLAYVSFVPSASITFRAFPAFTFNFPQSLVPAGTTLHEAFLDGATAQPVYQYDIAFGANGATLSSTYGTTTLLAGKTYVYVIYLESGTASPSPGPTSTPTTAPSTAPSSSPAPATFLHSPVTITKVTDGFNAGGQLYDGAMALGSDGKLWLADQRTQAIRPLDPATRVLGAGYSFKPPGFSSSIRPAMITNGVDGRLWIVSFDDVSNIYAMSLDGTIQKISQNAGRTDYVNRLVAGSDGRMWGIAANTVRAFTAAGVMSVYPMPVTTRTGNDCPSLTLNSDGNVWYVCRNAVGKVTPSGTITEYPGNGNTFIGAGTEGSVWIMGSGLHIARVSASGAYTEYPLPNYEITCTSMVRGPDDALYLGCGNNLYRVTPSGASIGTITLLANYQTANYTTGFAALTVGPDNHSLWSVDDGGPYAQLIQ